MYFWYHICGDIKNAHPCTVPKSIENILAINYYGHFTLIVSYSVRSIYLMCVHLNFWIYFWNVNQNINALSMSITFIALSGICEISNIHYVHCQYIGFHDLSKIQRNLVFFSECLSSSNGE